MGTTLTTSPRLSSSLSLLACAALLVISASAWTPGVGQETASRAFSVNTQSRNDVISFWNSVYQKSEGYQERINWTGSTSSKDPGTISAAFKSDVERRINYYRAMAGMSADIKIVSGDKQEAAQATALMLSLNSKEFDSGGEVSQGISNPHSPPNHWVYSNELTQEGAGNSNLAIGKYGPEAIDAYISENDQAAAQAENSDVGHRRYILHSLLQEVATGDVTATGSNYFSANTLYIRGNLLGSANNPPAPAPQFISWPNSGFIPEAIVPQHWSLSYPEADFSSATISMRDKHDNSINTTITSRRVGYGDNAIVWKPNSASIFSTEFEDATYHVTISNIIINGNSSSHNYSVTIINPNRLTEYPTLSSSTNTTDTDTKYYLSQVDQAEAYELDVSRQSNASWTEGAEDSTSPYIIDGTSSAYALRKKFTWSQYNGQNFWDQGEKAFRLAFPNHVLPLSEETFTINRVIIPKTGASLSFRLCRGLMTPASRLEVQYSNNGGGSWTTLSTYNGNQDGSPDGGFATKNVDLSPNENETLIRFLLHQPTPTGVYDIGSFSGHPAGVFIDAIQFLNCDWLQPVAQVGYPKSTDSITLDDITDNGQPIDNDSFKLRVRPKIGTQWLPYGPSLQVGVTVVSNPDPDPDPDNPAGPLSWSQTAFSTAAAGKYAGFLSSPEDNSLPGFFESINFSSEGYFSAKMYFGTTIYLLKGRFDETGRFQTAVAAEGEVEVSPAIVDLSLIHSNGGGFKVVGTVEVGEQSAEVSALKNGDTTHLKGRYTLLIPAVESESAAPQGHGYGKMKVSINGIAKISGHLGDGKAWKTKCRVTPDGEMLLYKRLYNKQKGWLGGTIRFRDVEGVSDFDGEVQWHKPGKAGFKLQRTMIGSRYKKRAVIAGEPETKPNVIAAVSADDESAANAWEFAWSLFENGKAFYTGPSAETLQMVKKNGQIGGSILEGEAVLGVKAVVFQKQGMAAGMVQASGKKTRSLIIEPKEAE